MAKKVVITAEEQELLHDVDDLIEERVRHRVETQIKARHHHKIDEEAIRKKCAKEVFHEIEEATKSAYTSVIAFFDLLKLENAHLFDQIEKQSASVLESTKDATNFHEFFEQGKMRKIDPKLLEEVYTMGLHHYQKKQYDKAYLYFNWMSMVDPSNPQAWFNRGVAEQNLHKFNEAISSYLHLLSHFPRYMPAYAQLMNCLLIVGKLDTAKQVYEEFTHLFHAKDYDADKPFAENLARIKSALKIEK